MNHRNIIANLKTQADPENIKGMERFGINPKYALGINIPVLRKYAKEILQDPNFKNSPEKRHKLASLLWNSNYHEIRILASMIDVPEKVTKKQMDEWITKFNSWDLCDQVSMNLFDKTPFAFEKAVEWTKRKKEFEKRAGFALMACLAWHDKKSSDKKFIAFFPHIKRESTDERNFVKKSVNWALRQIGKKNKYLNERAIEVARQIEKIDSKSAKWIAKDAICELISEKIQKRIST